MTAAEIVEHYGPAAAEVLQVKPGLTGLWQVKGRSSFELSPAAAARSVSGAGGGRCDSMPRSMLVTIPRVLTGKDAW